jgi:hypothetical protein
MQEIYSEFEKYYRPDNDYRKKAGGAKSKQTREWQEWAECNTTGVWLAFVHVQCIT